MLAACALAWRDGSLDFNNPGAWDCPKRRSCATGPESRTGANHDGWNQRGWQTSAPKAAWYETIKPAVASTLTLAVTGAIYGAVSGAVQDATSALLKASPPSKSGADLNAGALPLAAWWCPAWRAECAVERGQDGYDRINEKDWLGDWGRRARGCASWSRPGGEAVRRRPYSWGPRLPRCTPWGGSADYSENDEARTALPAWSGR